MGKKSISYHSEATNLRNLKLKHTFFQMVNNVEKWAKDIKHIMGLDEVPYWWSVDCIDEEGCKEGHIPSSNPGRRLVLSEINCSCLGLVADTSPEAKVKGMKFADMIADICLG